MQTLNINIEVIDNGYVLNAYVYGEEFGPVGSTTTNDSKRIRRYFQDDQSVADAVAAVLAVEL